MRRAGKPILTFGAATTVLFCARVDEASTPRLLVVPAGAPENNRADITRMAMCRFLEAGGIRMRVAC